MVTKTQAIANYLKAKTHPDLANLYNHDLECQVVVGQDGGEPIEGEYKGRQWRGWTDHSQVWKPIRIPYNAMKDPSFNDSKMSFDLEAHCEGIGLTGWNWVKRCSSWVAYDFDAISGHSDKHTRKLSTTELDEIVKLVLDIPWVTVRKSTGGQGLHLYVFCNDFPTQNHNEHAAVARAILGKMSALVGYDFSARVDICGGNMWVWHRKMLKSEQGLELIKQGEVLDDCPSNWTDHIKVISGRSKKTSPLIEDARASLFDEISGQSLRVPLDETHKELISYLDNSNFYWFWDTDNHMLVTHTWYLAKAYDDLNIKGIFKTNAEGSDAVTDYNCFMFPLRKGAWAVRRYSPGVEESETWDQDGAGWTRCYFNREADLPSASKVHHGVEDTTGGFEFREGLHAAEAASYLGINLNLPDVTMSRRTLLKEHRDGRLIVEIDHQPTDDGGKFKGWLLKKNKWQRIFNVRLNTNNEPDTTNYDDVVRHCVTESGEDSGWLIKSDSEWRVEPLQHVKIALEATGLSPAETRQILGSSVFKCWKLVNRPFQPEYPGDRQWNRNAAQLKFLKREDKVDFKHPSWDKILNHVGYHLNNAILSNGWCKANGITSGADYLRCWIASIFQEPLEPLPYLFFYGPQNSGKSIFHEALKLLITVGYQRADHALVSSQGFNGELQSAIICVVEETNLSTNVQAYNRIKDWVTSPMLPIHTKNRTPFLIPNSTHWIQTANDANACPIFPGDTRITMSFVDSLDPLELVPKKYLMQQLETEAQDFISSILSIELPPSNDRLNVPVLETDEKRALENMNKNALDTFIGERCHYVEGEMILFSQFYDVFMDWLELSEQHQWSKIKVGRTIPPQFPKGRVAAQTNKVFIGNISWHQIDPVKPKLKLSGDNLVHEND